MSNRDWSLKTLGRRQTFSRLVLGVVLLGLSCSAYAQEAGASEAEKEALLAEANICRRASLLLRHLSVAATDDRVGLGKVFPPQFSMN